MGTLHERLTMRLDQGVTYSYTGGPRPELPLNFTDGAVSFELCYYESNGKVTTHNSTTIHRFNII